MPEPARPRTVLIAEDEPVIAMGIEAKLRRLGWEVIATASDGDTALRLARDLSPDVLVLDVKMPGISGLDVAAALSEEGRARPTVILTAYEDECLVDRAVAVGVGAYLVKPATEAQLAAAVKLAASRFSEFQTLRKEVEDLREALEARKLLERAKGVLVSRLGLSEEEAFRRIQKAARDRRLPMAEMARSVIQAEDLFSD
ncbi:MAG: response regulator [Acidobacteria bacterium]|nr:response regulator [Acidobacteriota bacterium]